MEQQWQSPSGAGLGVIPLSNIGVSATQEIPYPGKRRLRGRLKLRRRLQGVLSARRSDGALRGRGTEPRGQRRVMRPHKHNAEYRNGEQTRDPGDRVVDA